mmetsp:Transcript_59802/g.159179  ORF Transcript_59802/g.159179 Transcript_59802/m.159179 type:complete len:98 (-) Transcript_59802:178-471(-)|eukprot:CAMPEP_0194484126 /NCGR_PEP_ID=MMETSP0253-20130528/5537_1 /TAXON_ID=2966 /ORGANISM="Noctiluca scintillans" /LENGTH=97 /DNA_ID=CAMNT_0039323883 /DNA_START=329 /DNA_END=622 /DNA_ORIENTATION=+
MCPVSERLTQQRHDLFKTSPRHDTSCATEGDAHTGDHKCDCYDVDDRSRGALPISAGAACGVTNEPMDIRPGVKGLRSEVKTPLESTMQPPEWASPD